MRNRHQSAPTTLANLAAVTTAILDRLNRLGENSVQEERFKRIKEADYKRAALHGHVF